ncbi:hypothetical protein M569_16141, partial [Genlisea aurea]
RRIIKVSRLGGAGAISGRSWRFRLGRKVRLMVSPAKFWCKLKNAYVNTMLRINGSGSDSAAYFDDKRIPNSRDRPTSYSRSEFENRLILEMYKSVVPSLELGYKVDL